MVSDCHFLPDCDVVRKNTKIHCYQSCITFLTNNVRILHFCAPRIESHAQNQSILHQMTVMQHQSTGKDFTFFSADSGTFHCPSTIQTSWPIHDSAVVGHEVWMVSRCLNNSSIYVFNLAYLLTFSTWQ